ncbi:MAG TPA: coproporphyrinogen dehydrogenase HemZ [Clostridiales bacterium]|nr:coproporphyrinogen dehydrogenase HemZ [Clostridiales bacterium]
MILVKAPQVNYDNEIMELAKVFFPDETVAIPDKSEDSAYQELTGDHMVLTSSFMEEKPGFFSFMAALQKGQDILCEHKTISSSDNMELDYLDEERSTAGNRKSNRVIKNGLKGCVFDLLAEYTGKHPKWGALTGIRPVKLVHEMLDKGFDYEKIRQELLNVYKLHPEKADLLIRTAENQRPLIDKPYDNKASVYIHIPFCSTRCHYCSFPSDLISRVSNKMDAYLDCLEQELAAVMNELLKQGTQVDTIYIGGGTPTVLEHIHLEKLLCIVQKHIAQIFKLREYTVEAGRPDSLDKKKLQIMKDYGVTRVSINPQSMNQETLDLIGRSHTVEDIVRIFMQAREIGYDCINMDVILGLPGETEQHMRRTMESIAALKPDNITIHTLAVKRASAWKDSFRQYDPSRKGLAEEMAEVCREWLDRLGMEPYYLYRQKYMLDHLENIGYALPGKECLYNIQFMDEKRDIWAFGAGASSKIYYPGEDRLVRIGNVKNLDEYLSRVGEMIEKKLKVLYSS